MVFKNDLNSTTNPTICVVGLGYVGLPLAVAFSQHFPVIGFDLNTKRIAELNSQVDKSHEISKEQLAQSQILFTSAAEKIRQANIIIICVPTPVDENKKPDLSFLESASKIVGENLPSKAIVVYESTVYPGCTEEVCLPVLEKFSDKKCPQDFKIGYSPERINPGDKQHTIDKVIKIVSGVDQEALEVLSQVYGKIALAGIHQAPNIKTAEAAKVIENIQRDLNIALVNELALIFHRVGIKTKDVLAAAGSKWNFHPYQPSIGPGGHCIPVDPYYLTFKAEQLGYYPQVILAGRSINNYMAKHVTELIIKGLNEAGKVPRHSRLLILGLTFKENVNDHRNSRAADLIHYLKEFGVQLIGHDPLLEDETVKKVFGVENKSLAEVKDLDGIIVITPHRAFSSLSLAELKAKTRGIPLLVDTRSFFSDSEAVHHGFIYKNL